jgi:hypothetical protein
MSEDNNTEGYNSEFIQHKQHKEQVRWLEERGLEMPEGCTNPLEILIKLEVEYDLNLNLNQKSK